MRPTWRQARQPGARGTGRKRRFIANRHGVMPAGTQGIRKSLDMGPLRPCIQFTPVKQYTMSSQLFPHPVTSDHKDGDCGHETQRPGKFVSAVQETFAFMKRFMYRKDRRYDT